MNHLASSKISAKITLFFWILFLFALGAGGFYFFTPFFSPLTPSFAQNASLLSASGTMNTNSSQLHATAPLSPTVPSSTTSNNSPTPSQYNGSDPIRTSPIPTAQATLNAPQSPTATTPQAPSSLQKNATAQANATSTSHTNATTTTQAQTIDAISFPANFLYAEDAENFIAIPTGVYASLVHQNAHLSPEEQAKLLKTAIEQLDPAWLPLIKRLTTDGLNETEMLLLFSRLGPKSFSPGYMAYKVTELHGVYGIGLPKNPEEETLIPEGFEQPLPAMTAGACKAFSETYSKEFTLIQKKHGVPSNVIIAILLIETGLGTNLGDDSALRSLGSMAATTSPQILGQAGNSNQIKRINAARLATTLQEKSNWAYNELKALIQYGKQNKLDVATLPGSMYGAIGLCQFMPSNIVPYGVDGDKDGKIDLFSVTDALFSVASYLEAHGWRGAKTTSQQFSVILQYNYDSMYASSVLGVANKIDLAQKGKLSIAANPLGGVYATPGGYLDPSLRRKRFVPQKARIKSLDNYADILGD